MKIRALIVCVEYDDILRITLPHNLPQFDDCLIVTSLSDKRTQELCSELKVSCFKTNAFYEKGAKFNKGLAVEQSFDHYGRNDWILILDADIILPYSFSFLRELSPGYIYGVHRRIINNPFDWNPSYHYKSLRRERDMEIAGYFQFFCCEDGFLKSRPWYDVTFAHAGGCDSYFQQKWPKSHRVKLPHDVIHLGPRDKNWFGRTSQRLDKITLPEQDERKHDLDQLHRRFGWAGFRKDSSVECLNRIESSEFNWHGDQNDNSGNGDHSIQGQKRS